jgi:hypothetical protein
VQPITQAFAEAAATAGRAPSIDNSQPWRWQVRHDAKRSRQLSITDPDGRLATLNCGPALHHARTSLAAHCWHADVVRLPDLTDSSHLARITIADPIPVTTRRSARSTQQIIEPG